jgi:putative redox protein
VTQTKTVEAVWEGGMRFRAATGSGHAVPADDGASGTAPRPTELVLAGLAMCTAMDIVSILDKKRQDYDTYRVHATAQQREEYPQVFTRIDLVHEVAGPGVTEAGVRRCVELSATKYCPVSAMLAMGETEIHHGYRLVNTGADPFTAQGEVMVTGPHWVPTVTS